jgi:phosphohistidine phosphatase SixA
LRAIRDGLRRRAVPLDLVAAPCYDSPVRVGNLLLHRHASAGERVDDERRDRRRRLDSVGLTDARSLARTLGSARVARIVSSPLPRCVESVMPLARARGLEVLRHDALTPEAPLEETIALLETLADDTLVCTHREVIERVFDGSVKCEKGGTWLIDPRPGHMRAIAYVPPASALRRERRPSAIV